MVEKVLLKPNQRKDERNMITISEIIGRRQIVAYNNQNIPIYQFRRWSMEGLELQKVIVFQKGIELETTDCFANKEESKITVTFDETKFDLSKYVYFKAYFWCEQYQRFYDVEFYQKIKKDDGKCY